jgi:hypothetical protein
MAGGETMDEPENVIEGLQCCLLCGRVLTDRVLHDRLEEPALASIRAEHPEWASLDGACAPCVDAYRKLLADRITRDERLRQQAESRRWWVRVGRLFGRDQQNFVKAANQPRA